MKTKFIAEDGKEFDNEDSCLDYENSLKNTEEHCVNKWFNSYNEAVSYYDNLILDYSNKIHNGQITFEEYNKQCPCGYEIWSCQYCGKWTLNYYKR